MCATGNYARQTGRMFGLNVPAIPVEHQYIVYDESKELKDYRTRGGRRKNGRELYPFYDAMFHVKRRFRCLKKRGFLGE